MSTQTCENCPKRAKYDKKPKSLIGRLWRWHVGFCPGWKKYFNSNYRVLELSIERVSGMPFEDFLGK